MNKRLPAQRTSLYTPGQTFENLPPVDPVEIARTAYGERTLAQIAALDKPAFAQGSNATLRFGRTTATKTGLQIPNDLSSDEFKDLGDHIFALEGVTQWWIGDYLLHSELKWGDITDRISEHFGRERQTLWNIASVARKFETSRRREVLTFAHHEAVAAKSPDLQDYYLNTAVEQKLSVKALRAFVKQQESNPIPKDDAAVIAAKSAAMIRKLYMLSTKRLTAKRKQEGLAMVETVRHWLDEQEAKLKE